MYQRARTHRRYLIAACAAALVVMPLHSGAAVPGAIHVESGWLQGVPGRDAAVTVFKGVPYAAAPVGDLRWRAPQPAPAWKGVRAADRFGAVCPQSTLPAMPDGVTPTMDEDCLTANIWTAKAASEVKRPVFVWIYGGGFSVGSGAQPEFDGEALAKKGVVVVTFNYRIGALGFLATPELSRESGHDASGNYGLLDDIALLKWVKANIAAFGGDPDQVTIGGQSAGAGSSGFLAMSPLAKGLFKRAILESHARYSRDLELRYLSVSYRTKAAAETAGQKFVAEHGAHSLAEMRATPWQNLVVGNVFDMEVDTGSPAKPPLFRPVVDGWVLPHDYEDTYRLGTQNDVSILAGNNKDETGAVPETAFAAIRRQPASDRRPGEPHTNVTLDDFRASARAKFGAMADEFLKLYPASNDDEAALQNNASVRDNSRVSTYLWGTQWRKANSRPVYTYFWTHALPGPSHDRRGAFHGSEIPYVFDSLDALKLPFTDDDRKIGDTMSSYWANFIKTGNPNGAGLPAWPGYSPQTPQVMAVGDQWGPIPVASPAKIDFWKRFFATQTAW
jgi:para-nitrobenzyl esterase